jgi:hypothetical protein
MRLPSLWDRHIRRSWPRSDAQPSDAEALDPDRLMAEVEEGLRDIEFAEVTTEDRITFVEYAVAWQVRRALRCGRFDLALQLGRFGVQRIGELHAREHGFRPILLYGIPQAPRRNAEPNE